MNILVTGSAGFIGSELSLRLLERGDSVIGIDNHNDYYDPAIKEARLARYVEHPRYTHLRIDLADSKAIEKAFSKYNPQRVVNLAAQAGVRYSIDNPMAYINSNIIGFANILEGCRHNEVEHLVYASSSSVYGANALLPFSVHQNTDHPLSLYAASKKSNELMAHSYSNLFNLATTGLRFFTVYGPWGRPDMALFQFTRAILAGEKISVFNYGLHQRDFTYIDDIVESTIRALDDPATSNLSWSGVNPDPGSSESPWRIYNVGNSRPVQLMDYIFALEEGLGKKADIQLLPQQPGDISDTYADVEDFVQRFEFRPSTPVKQGVINFVEWYRTYYKY